MRKLLLALVILAMTAWAANVKLYLKDGSYHIVREYKTEGDRVKYYSVERSSWEEIPVALVDLKRTESEIAGRKAALAEEAKVSDVYLGCSCPTAKNPDVRRCHTVLALKFMHAHAPSCA